MVFLLACCALLAGTPPRSSFAADPAPADTLKSAAADTFSVGRRSVPLAVVEGLGINVVVNVFDRLTHEHPEEFYVTPESWWDNIQEGFEWDDNHFITNQFAHPYHGSTYFNAGRSNGLDFWESSALTALGSLTWEYFGEKNRPSYNDFYNTTIGGIALGEMFHRTATTVRDNRSSGLRRFWRESAAFVIDPVGGFNRIFRGEAWRVYANPKEHDPAGLTVWLRGGVRSRGDEDFRFGSEATGSVFDLRMLYGDALQKAQKPFDTFSFRIETASADSGLINGIRGEGFLVAFGEPERKINTHRWVLTQRFDFYDNAAYQFGGQSVEARWLKRWGSESSNFVAFIGGQVVILGAVNSEHTGLTQRQYDYGPGLGTEAVLTWVRNGDPFVRFEYGVVGLDTKAGDNASHWLHKGDLEVTYLLTKTFGLSAAGGYFRRDSYYDNSPDVHQWSPEWRASVAYRTH